MNAERTPGACVEFSNFALDDSSEQVHRTEFRTECLNLSLESLNRRVSNIFRICY